MKKLLLQNDVFEMYNFGHLCVAYCSDKMEMLNRNAIAYLIQRIRPSLKNKSQVKLLLDERFDETKIQYQHHYKAITVCPSYGNYG